MNDFSSQFSLLTQALEFAHQNHRVISQNIANVNTPNYRAQGLSFEQFLEHLESSDHYTSSGRPPEYTIEYVPGLATRTDGNNVDLDRELANLKKNTLVNQTLSQLLGSQMSIMRRAITG